MEHLHDGQPVRDKCKKVTLTLIAVWLTIVWTIGLQVRQTILRQTSIAAETTTIPKTTKDDEENTIQTYRGEVQYISFEPWNGGWNNKRMSIESAILYAALTNRTLVLPPKLKTASTRSAVFFEDFFDLQNLRKYISVMTWSEFEPLVSSLPVSKNFENEEVDCSSLKYKSPIHWCKRFRDVRRRARQVSTPMLKSIFTISGSTSSQDFNDFRLNKAPVPWDFPDDYWVHFPQNLFGHFYHNFYFGTITERTKWFTFMKNCLKIRPDIQRVADSIIKELGPENYNSVHFRQGDFKGQFKNYVTTPDDLVDNLKSHIMDKSVLYLATDEKDDSVIRRITHSLKPIIVKRYSDFEIINQISADWIPVIEMLICSSGSHFTGSKLSTFSGYITRLRGYNPSPTINKQLYYTDSKYTLEVVLEEAKPYSWNSKGSGKLGDFRGIRVWWNREYPESWNI